MDWPSEKIRSVFLDFFSQKNHKILNSSKIYPHDDLSILFTNSGMVQFKPLFLGKIEPQFKRITTCQKCIRAGGKHNDLDDVGKDSYHHTFFEMLGNFSFGDYYQEEIIKWSFELLTEIYKLDKNRLYITYYGGSENIPPDLQAKKIWSKYMPESRILPFQQENFWEMGPIGPCGPCSEIHYDKIGNREAPELVNKNSPDLIEIWNIVFMQYNRLPNGQLVELANKNIDTGMGLERLTSILQNQKSNYDTDLFALIFDKILELTGINHEMAYRIISDHIRAVIFSIADGIYPDSKNRSYIIRRIIRRAIRAYKEYLKTDKFILSELVDSVIGIYGPIYPELITNQDLIKNIIKSEENLFNISYSEGIKFFRKLIKKYNGNIPPDKIIILYNSYGFPMDLIQIIFSDHNIQINMDILNLELEKLKSNNNKIKFDYSQINIQNIIQNKPTKDSYKYQLDPITAKILAIINLDGEIINSDFISGKLYGLLLDQTNFYSQAGGQISDMGSIFDISNNFNVVHVENINNYIIHFGFISTGYFKINNLVICQIDKTRRLNIQANHTATHLLNLAIRKFVDPNSDQRGSLVTETNFRFDFNTIKNLDLKIIKNLEFYINKIILDQLQINSLLIKFSEAKQICGIRSIFTENYPELVRVIIIGVDPGKIISDKSNKNLFEYSIELCGGTHSSNTRDLELFKIIDIEQIQFGITRLIGVTGDQAKIAILNSKLLELDLINLENLQIDGLNNKFIEFSNKLNSQIIPLENKIEFKIRLSEITNKIKLNKKLNINKQEIIAENFINSVNINNNKYIIEQVSVGDNNRILSDTASDLVKKYNLPVLLFSIKNNILKLSCNIPKDNQIKANLWLKNITDLIGGKSGGSDLIAQGICPNFDGNINSLKENILKYIK